MLLFIRYSAYHNEILHTWRDMCKISLWSVEPILNQSPSHVAGWPSKLWFHCPSPEDVLLHLLLTPVSCYVSVDPAVSWLQCLVDECDGICLHVVPHGVHVSCDPAPAHMHEFSRAGQSHTSTTWTHQQTSNPQSRVITRLSGWNDNLCVFEIKMHMMCVYLYMCKATFYRRCR